MSLVACTSISSDSGDLKPDKRQGHISSCFWNWHISNHKSDEQCRYFFWVQHFLNCLHSLHHCFHCSTWKCKTSNLTSVLNQKSMCCWWLQNMKSTHIILLQAAFQTSSPTLLIKQENSQVCLTSRERHCFA